MSGDELYFDWSPLVALIVHPAKVAIVEALLWFDEPLSPKQLTETFGGSFGLSLTSYHTRGLAKLGVLTVAGHRHVRGARQTFYQLSTDPIFFQARPMKRGSHDGPASMAEPATHTV